MNFTRNRKSFFLPSCFPPSTPTLTMFLLSVSHRRMRISKSSSSYSITPCSEKKCKVEIVDDTISLTLSPSVSIRLSRTMTIFKISKVLISSHALSRPGGRNEELNDNPSNPQLQSCGEGKSFLQRDKIKTHERCRPR